VLYRFCIVVEGVHVKEVLGANVCLTASKIIDVTGETPVEMKGFPARSVVIPGSYTKKFPAGDFPCAIIIGTRHLQI
jgi:2,3,4,5-tetrahydropyridine-2-carboxylate N-succinyltransferase